jgi:hypothetical protein
MATPLPNIALDFTTGSLDPKITFARSGGTATRFNSSGLVEAVSANVPRFDFDPIALACSGLLIEEARLSLAPQSQALNVSPWATLGGSITADNTTSPDGTLNADKFTEDTGNSRHRVTNSLPASLSAITYTASVFVKYNDCQWITLAIATGVSLWAAAKFDIQNGALGSTSAQGAGYSATSSSITPVGNGWYRCVLTAVNGNASFGSLGIYTATDGTTFTANQSGGEVFTGTGRSIFAWGAQLEAGAFATSYIPTTTAAVTRNADVATITGTNFSDFWQASKGGASVLATPSTVSGIRPLVQFDDNTADNIIALRGNAANPELQIVDGGAPQVQLDAGTIVANTPYSLTGWWQTNDCKARKDSGAVVTDTTATIPTVTQARIGSDGTNYLNGTIATINYYDSFFGRPIYTRRKNKVFPSLL